MSLNAKNNCEGYVVTAGVLYGNGEEALHDLFKGLLETRALERPNYSYDLQMSFIFHECENLS